MCYILQPTNILVPSNALILLSNLILIYSLTNFDFDHFSDSPHLTHWSQFVHEGVPVLRGADDGQDQGAEEVKLFPLPVGPSLPHSWTVQQADVRTQEIVNNEKFGMIDG